MLQLDMQTHRYFLWNVCCLSTTVLHLLVTLIMHFMVREFGKILLIKLETLKGSANPNYISHLGIHLCRYFCLSRPFFESLNLSAVEDEWIVCELALNNISNLFSRNQGTVSLEIARKALSVWMGNISLQSSSKNNCKVWINQSYQETRSLLSCCEHHKQNFIHLQCTGVEEVVSEIWQK